MRIGIAGGGPSGLIAGIMLLKGGFEVDLFEEHSSIGFPAHCAGVISLETFLKFNDILGGRSTEVLERRICGIRIGVPAERDVQYVGSRVKAVVVDRPRLDKLLAEVFVEMGGRLHLNSKVEVVEGGEMLFANGEVRKFEVSVDAMGVKSLARRRRKGLLPAMQVEVKSRDFDDRVVEIWFDKNSNPDFFYWVYPVSKETVRVGTASLGSLKCMIESFVRWRFGEINELNRYYGTIIVSGPVKPFVKGLNLCVGDSAGQTKPLTGGGLRYGFSGAEEASKVIASHFSEGTPLRRYEDEWFRIWGKEIDVQRKIRGIYEKLTADEVLRILGEVDEDLLRLAVTFGEMDRFRETTLLMVKSGRMLGELPLLLKLIKHLVKT